jgi:hypothetical protein
VLPGDVWLLRAVARSRVHGGAGTLPGGKAKLASLVGSAEPCLPDPGAGAGPASDAHPTKGADPMADSITTRARAAVAQLADELDYAERLIEEQANRIGALEAEVARLRRRLLARTFQ